MHVVVVVVVGATVVVVGHPIGVLLIVGFIHDTIMESFIVYNESVSSAIIELLFPVIQSLKYTVYIASTGRV